MNTRRAFLGGAGAALLTVLGYRAWDRGVFGAYDGPAYRPWLNWRGRPQDGVARPLRAAVLAANPHDTQPWLFTCGDDSIELLADRERHLGSFDPFRREMHLGLGCAVENLSIAARAFGFSTMALPAEGRLGLSPGPDPVPAVLVATAGGPAVRDPLFDVIPLRHTNRGPYRAHKPIAPGLLAAFQAAVDRCDVRLVLVTDAIARAEFAAMEVEATQRIVDDPEMSADSARWFRRDKFEVDDYRDGVTIDAAGLPPLIAAEAKLLPGLDARNAGRAWLDMTRYVQAETAALFGVILVHDRFDMASAVSAGSAWQRLHLTATLYGVAAQPMNQPVEMADRDAMTGRPDRFVRAMSHFTHMRDWEPTFVFRMGYAKWPAGPSPRRPLRDVIVGNG